MRCERRGGKGFLRGQRTGLRHLEGGGYRALQSRLRQRGIAHPAA